MSQALNELRKIVEEFPMLRDLTQQWIERWVTHHHATAMIDYEALKHARGVEDLKEYYKKGMLNQIARSIEPYMEYEEEFIPAPFMTDRLVDQRFPDLSVPVNLKMKFDLLMISEKPKEEI